MIRIYYTILHTDPAEVRRNVIRLHDAAWGLLSHAFGGPLPEIRRSPEGKPFFADAQLPVFSLSHASRIAVCAISDGPPSFAGIGVDVQDIRPCKDDLAIMRHFFHPSERERVLAIPDHETQILEFYRTFSCKEAYVKMTGKGLGEDFHTFEADPEAGVIRTPGAFDVPGIGAAGEIPAVGHLYLPWGPAFPDPEEQQDCPYILALCTPAPLPPAARTQPIFVARQELKL